MKPRVFLALPPNYSFVYDSPPLGTACLTAFLKARGYPVAQADHNLGYLDYMRERAGLGPGQGPSPSLTVHRLLTMIFGQKAASRLYYAPLLAQRQDGFVPYNDITNSSFRFTEGLLSSAHLERYLDDDAENTFRQYYLDRELPRQIVRTHDVLGLSVISPAQVTAALTLCRLVKELKADYPIVWGGQWPSLFRAELAAWGKLHRYVDAVILDEGETPLWAWLEARAGGRSLESVPNLLRFVGSRPRFSAGHSEEDLDQLPAPDFDGLPVERYTRSRQAGVLTLTYQASRQCYWNRCTFCVDLPLPKGTYRARQPELVVSDLKGLQAKHGCRMVLFSDPAMSPAYLRRLSTAILAGGLEVGWWCFCRLDGPADPQLYRLARQAGCQRINFGFESGCQRVCDFIDKGTRLATASRVVKACASAGIKVTLQTMLGLPTETAAEGDQTITFLLKHQQFVDKATFNVYYLTPGSRVCAEPARNRLIVDEKNRLPFQFFLEFQHADEVTLDRRGAEALIRTYESLVRTVRPKAAARPSHKQPPNWDTLRPRIRLPRPVEARLRVGRHSARLFCFPTSKPGDWIMLQAQDLRYLELADGTRTIAEMARVAARSLRGPVEVHRRFILGLLEMLYSTELRGGHLGPAAPAVEPPPES